MLAPQLSPLPSGVERLRTALDGVLVPSGFASAQGGCSGGGSGDTGGFVWCANEVEIARTHPGLLPAEAEPTSGACFDVTVELTDDHGTWRVTQVRVEGRDLDGGLVGLEPGDAADVLPGLLQQLLDAAAPPPR